jgi:hypothetical protein
LAATEWLATAVDDLLRHDLGRIGRQPPLQPIGSALRQLIDACFARYEPGQPLPGQAVRPLEGLPDDIRITRVTVGRTGGPYRVFLRYIPKDALFEIWRIGYPRGNSMRP